MQPSDSIPLLSPMSPLQLSRSPYRQSYAQSYSRQRRGSSTSVPWKFEFGPLSLIFLLLFAAIFMSFLYLAHFNQVATKGYDLKKLDAERQQLLGENEIKSARLAEARALNTMLQDNRFDGMRKADHVIFVRGDTAIASR